MMYTKVAMMALLGSAEAFNAGGFSSPSLATPRMTTLRMEEAAAPAKAPAEEAEEAPPAPKAAEMSEAMPFLTRRASLGPKGALVGDKGFDPLGFTEVLPLVSKMPPHHRPADMEPASAAHACVGMLQEIGSPDAATVRRQSGGQHRMIAAHKGGGHSSIHMAERWTRMLSSAA